MKKLLPNLLVFITFLFFYSSLTSTSFAWTCDGPYTKTCGSCTINGSCGSKWKECTYRGVRSDSLPGIPESCQFSETEPCDGYPDPYSCELPKSCNCGDFNGHPEFEFVGCGDSQCTGNLGGECKYCQTWTKPRCSGTSCINQTCSPDEDNCGLGFNACGTVGPSFCAPPTVTPVPTLPCQFVREYNQCGGNCNNTSYSTRNTVKVTQYNCNGTTQYQCQDQGQIPGQCGNPLGGTCTTCGDYLDYGCPAGQSRYCHFVRNPGTLQCAWRWPEYGSACEGSCGACSTNPVPPPPVGGSDTSCGLGEMIVRTINDYNHNGERDPGDDGLGNVRVHIRNADDKDGTTDSGGSRTFTGLSQDSYCVSGDAPTGFVKTNLNPNCTRVIDSCGDSDLVNLLFGPLYTISGRVYYDLNRNAKWDINEPVLPNSVVNMTGGKEEARTVGVDGKYSFPNLPANAYTLSVTYPNAFFAPSSRKTVVIGRLTNFTTVDFGVVQNLYIQGNVFLDTLNPAKGIKDDGEDNYTQGGGLTITETCRNGCPTPIPTLTPTPTPSSGSVGRFAFKGTPAIGCDGSNSTVTLFWERVTGAGYYKIFRGNNDRPENLIATTTNLQLTTTVAPEQKHQFTGRAYATKSGSETSVGGTANTTSDRTTSCNPADSVVTPTPSLPMHWKSVDINTSTPGQASGTGSNLTVIGDGGDINGTADSFYFVYYPLYANGSIIARMDTLSGGGDTAKAGLMIREALTANSRMAFISRRVDNAVRTRARTSTGGTTTDAPATTALLPQWMRLERTGSTFRAYLGGRGGAPSWVQVGSGFTISMTTTNPVYIGIAVAGYGGTMTGNFSNVSVQQPTQPTPLPTATPTPTTAPTPTIPVAPAGGYVKNPLWGGEYTVSLSSPLPEGFEMTFPQNGPPPTRNVFLGEECSKDLALDHGAFCENGSINNLNFGIAAAVEETWFQGVGGDMRLDNGFTDPIPDGTFANLIPAGGATHGILFSGSATFNFCQGSSQDTCQEKASATGMVVGNDPKAKFTPVNPRVIRVSYGYLETTAKQSGITATPITVNGCDGSDPVDRGCELTSLPHGLHKYVGDMYLKQSNFQNGNYVILVDGDLHILKEIKVQKGSTVTFAVSGDIIVDQGLGVNNPALETSNIEGFFSADGDFIIEDDGQDCGVGGSDLRLNVEGAIVANAALSGGDFINQRDLCAGNNQYPAVYIVERPDMILNAPAFIKHSNYIWREVAP